ncbi:MAG: Protein FecR [Paracidovorax wautersii]|uniref:Protein FecR n=1 Tax=Paracidovorax wautersii TaxID=1177982 RepID=A0A7V8FRI3_9BURK|nr:MAG: Protein FecR [Paracidovorax wautersii]
MIAATAGTAGLVANRFAPLAELTADLYTDTGQHREFALADGTTVLLDARSAVDTPAPGLLRLRAGALIASQPGARGEGLQIQTPHGRIVCGPAQAHCRLKKDATEVVGLDHTLRVQPQAGAATALRAGEGLRLTAAGTQRLPGHASDRAAWRDGMLAAEDWPLGDVVEALRAYYPGLIRVSEAAAAVRVFGIFRLDVEEALQTLAYTRPVQVHRLGRWLVTIDIDTARAAAAG